MSEIILDVQDLSIQFGGLKAVEGVHFQIKKNQIIGLIGPNGAGKTTIFNMLTGVYQPTRGNILLEDVSIIGKKPYEVNQMGIARTFQNIRLFKEMTVIDNIKLAMNHQMNYSLLSGVFRLGKYKKEEHDTSERAHKLLEFFNMDGDAHVLAGNLPYGPQRKLEILRAVASNPKVLLLDEPAAGMNPTETQELMETIQLIQKEFGISVLLIEHDMSFVMGISDYIFVLDYGQIIASGEGEEIRTNPQVIAAYLGGE